VAVGFPADLLPWLQGRACFSGGNGRPVFGREITACSNDEKLLQAGRTCGSPPDPALTPR